MTTEIRWWTFTPEFMHDTVVLVPKQGYSLTKAAQAVDSNENNLRCWKKEVKYGFIREWQSRYPVSVLKRDFTPTEKHRVWTTDITYIWTWHGWVSGSA